jgi:hypothetical protein
MRARGLFLVAVAALCLAVLLPSAMAAESLRGKKVEIGKEKLEEDEREDATDKEIVEQELAAELPGEEQFDSEQREALGGKAAGEEMPPEAELLAFRQSVVSGGTHVKVRVNPHGSETKVWMYMDWAKKCNTQVNCPTKGKYVRETAYLGSDSTRAKDLKGKFKVGECQVGEYVITAVNRWGVARVTGWFGDCY